MDLPALKSHADSGAVDTVVLAFCDLYGRLLGKRLDAGFFLADPSGTHVCDYLFAIDMEMEPIDGYDFASWDLGFGDVHLRPDLATLRIASWLDRTAIVLCDVESTDHEPTAVAPRSILSRQIQRLADGGFEIAAASELEYFLYRTSYRDAHAQDHRDLEPAGWYIEDYHLLQATRNDDIHGAFRRHLSASDIPVESTKGEWGRGQHEVNIGYAPVGEMADRHVLLKQICKEVADSMGVSVTFMAKPDASGAGSSSHLHLSLWRGDHNAFVDSDAADGYSDEFRWFLGGWMRHTAELMVCFAPTVNSYKRFARESWAPTAIAWSRDNRTAGFRIVGDGPSTRIECRLPGADVNPYLAYAAAIAAGLDGIEHRTEPPEQFNGDVYAATDLPHIPATLREAADLFGASRFARSAFGDSVVDHYHHFYTTEADAYDRAVTDWERARYFEQI
ncbi:MAG: glutamine synthetase [Acidobacteria bacterium]|nr:glutamine synthetase [Acidobacteriota bacterium]